MVLLQLVESVAGHNRTPGTGIITGVAGGHSARLRVAVPGEMKPLAIWLVPGGEGLTHPMRTPSPRGEGHSVDPSGLQAQDRAPVGWSVRMKSRSDPRDICNCSTSRNRRKSLLRANNRREKETTGGLHCAAPRRMGDERPGGGQTVRRRLRAGIILTGFTGPGSRPQPTEGGGDPATPPARRVRR
jgi:hypothetical protein